MPIVLFLFTLFLSTPAFAQDKPNIIVLISDDTGWGDLGAYGGGAGRGMPTTLTAWHGKACSFGRTMGSQAAHQDEQQC